MTIRFLIAIILSVFVHLLIIYLFFINKEKIKKNKTNSDDKAINLNLSTFEPSPKKATPKPKKIIKKKPLKKPKPKKKIIKKKPKPKKEPKKIEKKPIKKTEKKVQKKIIKKEPPKKPINKPKSFEESLMNMGTPHQAVQKPSNPLITKLYGSEFKSYTPKQKKFLNDNLETIHQITQRVLVLNSYPQEALDLFQEGVNVVSFYLYPNGSISHLKITRSSNSYFLDENTRQVIQMAYSQYPLPKQKTKIIFNVNYRIE